MNRNILQPGYLKRWINIKRTFEQTTGCKANSLTEMLQIMNLKFQITKSAFDDAVCVSQICWSILQEGLWKETFLMHEMAVGNDGEWAQRDNTNKGAKGKICCEGSKEEGHSGKKKNDTKEERSILEKILGTDGHLVHCDNTNKGSQGKIGSEGSKDDNKKVDSTEGRKILEKKGLTAH